MAKIPDRIKINVPFPEIYIAPHKIRQAEKLLRDMPEVMQEAYQRGCSRFAKIILAAVRKSIRTGMPPPGGGVSWPPLAERTKKLYKRWKYENTHPYLLTGQILRTVNIFKNNRGNYYVGLPRGVPAINPNPKKKDSTEGRPTLSVLVSWLEAGISGGRGTDPPRPLFNPAFKSAGGYSRLEKFIIQELRKATNKYGQ